MGGLSNGPISNVEFVPKASVLIHEVISFISLLENCTKSKQRVEINYFIGCWGQKSNHFSGNDGQM